MQKKSIVLVASVCSIAIAIFYIYQSKPSDIPLSASGSTKQANQPTPIANSPSAQRPGTPLAVTASLAEKPTDMLSQFQIDLATSNDLRAIFEKYKSLASDKNDIAYHLWMTEKKCSAPAYTPSGIEARQKEIQLKSWAESDKQRALAIWQKKVQRCSGFQKDPISESEIVDLRSKMFQSSAPASTVLSLLTKNRTLDSSQFSNEVSNAIMSRDSDAITQIPSLIFNDDSWRNTFKIDGNAISRQAISSAWRLAACDVGNTNICREEVEGSCSGYGRCSYANYDEMIRDSVLSPTEFEVAQKLRERIRTAIITKNKEALGL